MSASAESEFLPEVSRDYPDHLRDESRRTGRAESISFPRSEEEVRRHLARATELGRTVTIQGSRTGITAGAVPDGGHVLSLARMDRVLGLRRAADADAFFLAVQPGAVLSALRRAIAAREFDASGWSAASRQALEAFTAGKAYFFPPDPTETSASLGGMVACNASGAQTFRYGPTRAYVERMRAVLADGSTLDLRRGAPRARGRQFALHTEQGRLIEGRLPGYALPAVKNAAGYYAADDMDLVDLFIGSEGTLGVVTELELRLIPAPAAIWGIMAFFPDEPSAVGFVREVRGLPTTAAAIEFFDHGALDLLREQKRDNPAFAELPDMPAAWHTAIYVEYHGADEIAVDAAVMAMAERLAQSGGDPDASWIASDAKELARLKDFRHAVPESVNLRIDRNRKRTPGLTKLGTDLAVPDASLEAVLTLYHEGLDRAGLDYVMFGHIGNNHVHVNIIPRSMEEYDRGKALYLDWARAVVRLGGTVSAEHGIGKLKVALLEAMYGREGVGEMRALKRLFDPRGTLGRGNLFEAES